MNRTTLSLVVVVAALAGMLTQQAFGGTSVVQAKAAGVAVTAATSPPPTPTVTTTGTLAAVAAGSLTVSTTSGQTVITTDANTVVTVNGAASAVANLKVGMTVTISSVSGLATKVTAKVPVVHVAGKITAVSSPQVTVLQTSGTVTFVTDANTKVTVDGKAATSADLKAGMTLTASTGLGTATAIAAKIPVISVTGNIADVSGTSVTVQQKTGPVTFTTDANTVVTIDAKAATVAQLEAGMTAKATTELGVATKITAKIPTVKVAGTITAINGINITVQQKTAPVTFDTDGTTVVTVKAKPATVTDLKVGMTITGTTELGTATKIAAKIPVVSVTGTISDVNGAAVSVQQKTGPVTFTTDANTPVTIDAVAATVAQLESGMTVKATTELGIATKITAKIPTVKIAGSITAINGANITVQQKTAPVTFDTDGTTVVTVTAKAATVADLKVGMTVTGTTELGTATKIVAKIPVVKVTGTIASISLPQITVTTTTGPVSISTDANTKVTVAGKAATTASLTTGMTLTASTGLGLATTITAK